ncbi:hypothetical protein [Nocardia xishanensis]|uniref:hypothetical protein n=1 Tax=Nocardia xishanensis TaxID=238964 RepID=UPI00082B5D6F|nr:hypothetical protein [Nocardia xishanensis]
MADWPAYKAGSARLTLRPKLANDFRAQVKKQLAPINESLKVTVEPVLMRGFKTDLRTKLNAATKGLSVDIEARPKLAAGFRTDLRNKLNAATAGMTVKVGVKIDTTGVRSRIRGATTGVGNVKIPVDVDLTQATAQLEAFRTGQAAIPLTMNVNVDTAAAVAQLMALRSLAGAVGEQVGGIGTAGALGRGGRLRGNIFTRPIRAIRLQVELDRASVARAEAEVANIAARLSTARQRQGDALDRLRLAEERHNEVMSRANSTASQRLASTQRLARAQRDLADAQGRVNGLLGEEHRANQRLDRANRDQNGFRRVGRLFGAGLSGLTSAIGDAARNMFTFRNITNVALVGLVALAAVSLVPLIGQLVQAAGVVAILPAALSGVVAVISTLVVGTRGIGDAFKAASKAAESAGEDAEAHAKNVANAQKAAASAARGVADAQRGIVTAERGVRDAQRNTLQAQKDLNRARADAKKNIDDLNRALGRTALNEQSAAIAVAEAHREMLRTFADPEADAIDRARAQNSYNQALVDQQDVLRETNELRERAAEANEKGVDGSDEVVSAQERVNQAIESEGDARQTLADAHVRLADAQAALVEAQQGVIDAMNEGSTAAEAFEKAMGKLSPAAQDFVRQVLALKPALGELRRAVQESLFTGLGDSVTSLANPKWIDTLRTGLTGIAAEINGGVRRALADLDTDASRSKVAGIFENVRQSIGPVLDGLNDILQGFLSLSQVGSEFLPGLSGGFGDLAERFRRWAESPEGQEQFRNFLRESLRTFGQLMDIVKEFAGLVGEIFRGSDEVGESWFDSIQRALREWREYLSTPEGQQRLRDFFGGVQDTVKGILDVIREIVKLIDRIDGWNLDERFERSPVGAIAGLADPDKSAGEKALGVGKGIGGVLWDFSPIGVQGKLALTGFKDAATIAQAAWDGFTDAIEDEAGAVVGKFYELGTSAADFGSRAWDSLTNKVVPAFASLVTKLPDVESSLEDFKSSASDKFNLLQNVTSSVFDKITGPEVFGKFRDALSEFPSFFDEMVRGIGSAWSKVTSAIQGPINSVIDVLNSFGDIWNKVAGKLGLPTWDPIDHVGVTGQSATFDKPLVGARAMGGPGGPVNGPGNGKDDKAGLYRLSRGEHVWTADEVRAAGGHDAMYQMRRSVLKTGGQQSRGDGFADGGGVVKTSDPLDPIQMQLWDLVRTAIPSAVLTSAKRFVDVGSGYDLHMQGKAIDLGGPMQDISRWIYNTYPQSAELIHWPLNGWQNLDEGRPHDFGAVTNNQHRDHVHWAANDFLAPLSEEEKKGLFDRVREGIGGIVSGGRSLLVDNLLAKPLRGLADQVPVFDGLGEFGQIPKAFARKMADTVIGWVTSRLGGSSGSAGPFADWQPSAGAEQWRQMMIDAYRNQGYEPTPEKIDAWVRQIDTESGGNPNIAQQIVDVNGTGEAAGVGLGQMIPTTWQAYRDPSLPDNRRDPWAMTNAMVRYGEQKYGAQLLSVIGRGHGYDQGGILKNKHWGFNLSGLPEAVLTNPQWQMFDQFVQSIPGFNQQLKAIPQPLEGGTSPTLPSPVTPGVDTFEMVGAKAQQRFTSALQSGFDDLLSSTLGPLGLPDPRTLVPSEVIDYGKQLAAWDQARMASAQASQSLAQSGYQAAAVPGTGAANMVTQNSTGGATVNNIDNSMVFNISAANPGEGLRKAQQFADLHALQHTAKG